MNEHTQSPAATVPSESEVDDELLLLRVYAADEDPRGAEDALAALYIRHAGFLEAVCHKYHWHHPTRPARDFVNEAFVVVFRERPSFAPPATGTADSRRRAVRNFLCGICRFRYLRFAEKLGRELAAEIVSIEGAAEAAVAGGVTPRRLEEENETPTPPARTAINRFVESLEEDNRIILMSSAPYIDLKSGHCRMPPAEARTLAASVGLAIPVIRQRRKRMMDRIRELLNNLPDNPMKSP